MRRWLFLQLDANAWPGSGLSPINRLIAIAIFAAVFIAVMETEPTYRAAVPRIFGATDLIFGLLFSAEYVMRVWVAGEDPRYAGVKGRLKYVLSPIALIDLLALLPFLLTAGLKDAFILRLVRLLRLLTLARFGRYTVALRNIYVALRDRRHELLISLAAAFLTMLFAASALYFAEGRHNPESFGSIPRALWWGVATVTKVGYAGAFPVTFLGKVFGAIFAIAAVGVVALPTGILAASFGTAFRKERQRKDKGN